MRTRRLAGLATRLLLLAALLAVTVSGGPSGPNPHVPGDLASARGLEAVRSLAPGWRLRSVGRLHEQISSLMVPNVAGAEPTGHVYAGTTPTGDIYRFQALTPGIGTPIARGLGDEIRFGECCVNRLSLHDIDHDGMPELIASTSQIRPRGRPRLYVWSLTAGLPVLRAMTRPDIRSSWSHGLGIVRRPDEASDSLFVTFCGYGEVVEYRLDSGRSEGGFGGDRLASKQVWQLPTSGEWMQTGDLDNDGREEICVATGYASGAAAIHAYISDGPGEPLRQVHAIDEEGRFSNVKFLVGDLRGDGSREMVAWWVTDHIYGGDCLAVRYRLEPGTAPQRTVIAEGPADTLWPEDGQTALADLDGDGRPELFFASKSGSLYRYEPTAGRVPERILKIRAAIGPISAGALPNTLRPALFFGWGRELLRLDWEPGSPAR